MGTLQARRFGSSLPLTAGQTGSPVLATTNYTTGSAPSSCTETVGILSRQPISGTGSYSVRITAPIIQFYLQNPYV